MSLVLNAEAKSISANSYVSVAEADAIIAARLYVATWTAATSGDKAAALVWATRLLDRTMDWNGSRRTVLQALAWPRTGVYIAPDAGWYDYDLVPDPIKEATTELALLLLQQDRTAEPGVAGLGLSSLSVGNGAVSLGIDKSNVLPIIPPYILNMIQHMGSSIEIQPGMREVKLLRT